MKTCTEIINEVVDELTEKGFSPDELFEMEIRLCELDAEISVFAAMGKAARLCAAELELAKLFERIGPNAQAYFDALHEESEIYAAAHA